MTIRGERFLATLVLACLCNCATTKRDSTDSSASLTDLPEQFKEKEVVREIENNGGGSGEAFTETGSQFKPVSNDVSNKSPKTASALADLAEGQGVHSSELDQPDVDKTESTPSDSNLSSKAKANPTPSIVETQSEAPGSYGKENHSLESENALDIPEKTNDTNNFGEGNTNPEVDTPLADIFTKNSTPDSDSLQNELGEGESSKVNKPMLEKPLAHTDLKLTGSVKDLRNKKSSLDLALGLSTDEASPPEKPVNTVNRLTFESDNQPEPPFSSSPISNLGYSGADAEPSSLEAVGSTSLSFREPHSNGANIESDKSTLIQLGPRKKTTLIGPNNSPRRYVGLSQWLSRNSSKTSGRDDVYVGHSEPKESIDLESYIDKSPLVGIQEPIPWEYDSIARLLQPREVGLSPSSEKIGFDYESVRKFFGRKSGMGTTETNLNTRSSAFRYDGVLHWLDRRESIPNPPKAKINKARKYSNALNWIRKEGR
ncbi:MAG: hypothetical protein CMI26_12155 [Opitutae bacterium]|nr:hypothetical protein [Opitutae bacterium]